MSWTDSQIVNVIKYLRDKYNIKTFVETGTFKGINAELHSKNFKRVITCEKNHAYYKQAKDRLEWNVYNAYKNVLLVNEDSPEFLKKLTLGTYIFYLDAHFFDLSLPKGKRKFVVLRELQNMKKFKDSIIIIHDFKNNLGGICYEGINLDFNLLKKSLNKINKHFFFYTNTLEGCNPVKMNIEEIKQAGLRIDEDTLSNLEYMWSAPRLTYRGVLYCLPTELNKKELKELGLVKWGEIK